MWKIEVQKYGYHKIGINEQQADGPIIWPGELFAVHQ